MHGRFSIIGSTCPGCHYKSTPMTISLSYIYFARSLINLFMQQSVGVNFRGFSTEVRLASQTRRQSVRQEERRDREGECQATGQTYIHTGKDGYLLALSCFSWFCC